VEVSWVAEEKPRPTFRLDPGRFEQEVAEEIAASLGRSPKRLESEPRKAEPAKPE
jgi:hypothetical protein